MPEKYLRASATVLFESLSRLLPSRNCTGVADLSADAMTAEGERVSAGDSCPQQMMLPRKREQSMVNALFTIQFPVVPQDEQINQRSGRPSDSFFAELTVAGTATASNRISLLIRGVMRHSDPLHFRRIRN